MPDSLLDLEKRRSELLAKISTLGDFRAWLDFGHWRSLRHAELPLS